MKVVAFNGSPKSEGNTSKAIGIVADQLRNEGIEVEVVHVGNKTINGCQSCYACVKNGECIIKKDDVNLWVEKIIQADGIILGSPVYFAGINGTMKCFLDRAGFVLSNKRGILRNKVGVSLAAVRRTGGMPVLDTLNHFIQYFEMISPSSNYWSVIHGMGPGEILQDNEGAQTLRILGRNMAWLMKTVEIGKQSIPEPESEPKVSTNFIR